MLSREEEDVVFRRSFNNSVTICSWSPFNQCVLQHCVLLVFVCRRVNVGVVEARTHCIDLFDAFRCVYVHVAARTVCTCLAWVGIGSCRR